ncbi:hypothetical protein F4805DRAFT_246147 [Annulohypoxylon moriforme]|nr:hypothetical protein F4805DRAFT_246147 [Annulohypoxylon moriforme]
MSFAGIVTIVSQSRPQATGGRLSHNCAKPKRFVGLLTFLFLLQLILILDSFTQPSWLFVFSSILIPKKKKSEAIITFFLSFFFIFSVTGAP